MSLDVYLEMESAHRVEASNRIFIREGGGTVEITRAEWDARFPGREPVSVQEDAHESHQVYSANITHNLGQMAQEAGVYKALWRPEEIEVSQAKQLVPILEEGLHLLRAEPARFKQLNPENGWGTYDGLVEFVDGYLSACREHPEATIRTWR